MLNLNLWQRAAGSGASDDPTLPPRITRPLFKVAVLNTKGGCGKTTLSTSLAGYYALKGFSTAILDMDPQGSSLRWLANRRDRKPAILGLNGAEKNGRVTRSFQLRVPPNVERLVVDTPAAIDSLRLQDAVRGGFTGAVAVVTFDPQIFVGQNPGLH